MHIASSLRCSVCALTVLVQCEVELEVVERTVLHMRRCGLHREQVHAPLMINAAQRVQCVAMSREASISSRCLRCIS